MSIRQTRPAKAEKFLDDDIIQSPTPIDPLEAEVDYYNGLGLASIALEDYQAAIRFFACSLRRAPRSAAVHAYLAYAYLQSDELDIADILYAKTLELDPSLAIAYHGLAASQHKRGNAELEARYREQGLTMRPVTVLKYTGTTTPIELLLFGTPDNANIETEHFFDTGRYQVSALSVDHFPADKELPYHHIIFNGIGEADLAEASLRRALRLLEQTDVAVINHPDAVLKTGRALLPLTLGDISGVVTPKIVRIEAGDLRESALDATLAHHGLRYPFLVRVPGHHAGEQFLRIETRGDVAKALIELGAEEYFAIEFLDARGEDGLIRKYRVIFIDGKPCPIHLAVAGQWKVHYFSARTAEVEAYRREEECFLNDLEQSLGATNLKRLERIEQRLGLDYGGIDFGFDRSGNLLVFEANATMGFARPGTDPRWQWRRPALERADAAVEAMLRRRL